MAKTYESYKDSGIAWIGEIPSEWKVGLVGRYFNEIKNPNINQEEKNTLQFKMGDIISKKRGDSKYNPETIEAYNVVEPGTIMINGLNLSFDFISQRVGQVHEKGAITSTYLALYPSNGMMSDYAKYLLKAYDNCKALHAMGRGLRATLSYGIFRSEPILIPSIDEQHSIASFLDTKCGEIDSLISLQEEMISELQAYKQSVITEAVTKGLDPNAKMKDSGVEWIGEIPEGWKVSPLKYIIKGHLQYGANESGVLYEEGLPRYVRITDILDNKLREDIQKQSLTEQQAEGFILKNNDILFARSGGTVGKSFIYKSEYGRCAFAGYLIKASINDDNDAEFVYFFTQSSAYDEWKRRIFIQATIQNIGADKYSQLEIPLPFKEMQTKIVSFLKDKTSQIDSLITLKQQKIDELKDYKKSIIYEYVTGKKRV